MGKNSYRTMVSKETTVSIIGSGNVATHLALALKEKVNVVQVYSHTLDNARSLAAKISDKCSFCNDVNALQKTDIFIVSIKDDSVISFLNSVSKELHSSIWAHTSGSVGMDAFENFGNKYGVFYPLQTFSKNVDLEIEDVPFLIEGSDNETQGTLVALAESISKTVLTADSDTRAKIHLAAVFACNFSNYMYTISEDILKKYDIPFSILIPLIKETVRKASVVSPKDAQTGPAARGDMKIINKHIDLLYSESEKNIYKMISQEIMNSRK